MSKAILFKNKDDEPIYPCPFYPVGSIYISVSDTNPSVYFGGEWTQIKGQYLLGVDTGTSMEHKKAGLSIGSWTTENHILTVNEIPSHNHSIIKNVPYGIPYNDTGGTASGAGGGTFYHESYNPFGIINTGGGQGHNHGNFIPPSFTVFIWRRIK